MTFRTYWTSSVLNHETVTGSKFFAEYIYNAFALSNCTKVEFYKFGTNADSIKSSIFGLTYFFSRAANGL